MSPRHFYAIVSLMIVPVFLSVGLIQGEMIGLFIEDSDVTVKTLDAGENGRYAWQIRNDGNATFEITIETAVTGSEWVAAVEGKRHFTLTPGNISEVVVTVCPLTEDADGSARITVVFSISGGGESQDMVRTVNAERTGERLIFGLFENPLPSPLDGPLGGFLFSLVMWAMLVIILLAFMGIVVKRFTRKTSIKADDIILEAIRIPLIIVLSVYGLISSLEFLSVPKAALHWLDVAYGILFTVIMMYVVIRILTALVDAGIRVFEKMNEPSVSNMLLPMTRRIGSAVIFIIGLFTILHLAGLDITFFVTSMGVVGIVVAFAAQDTLSNVFAGLHLMLDQSFKIGDRILLPQKIGSLYSSWGDVLHIGLRSTKVRSTDGVILTIPNKMITENSLANFSHMTEPSLRVRIRFGLVPTWTNVKRAEELIQQIANTHPAVQEQPRAPQVILRDFGDYDAVMELRFYVESPRKMRGTKSELLYSILDAFEKNNVLMSTPTSFNLESRIDPVHMGYPGLDDKPRGMARPAASSPRRKASAK